MQQYAAPVAPLVEKVVARPVIQQYQPNYAPIVQEKIVPQIYERPIVS